MTSPYEAGCWDCLPIPPEGMFFKVGDRVRSRGVRKVHGVVRNVQAYSVRMHRTGVWEPAGMTKEGHAVGDGAFLMELITVQNDGEQDNDLSRSPRAQDYDLIERPA